MRYYDPNDVISPREFVENVDVIFDGGPDSVSIARIIWEGHERMGMRWNIARREWDDPEKINEQNICVGMPLSRAFPVWFILPEWFFDDNSEYLREIKKKIKNSTPD